LEGIDEDDEEDKEDEVEDEDDDEDEDEDEDKDENEGNLFLFFFSAFLPLLHLLLFQGDENMGGHEPHMIVAHQSLVSFHL
jgi:hypothetical protein